MGAGHRALPSAGSASENRSPEISQLPWGGPGIPTELGRGRKAGLLLYLQGQEDVAIWATAPPPPPPCRKGLTVPSPARPAQHLSADPVPRPPDPPASAALSREGCQVHGPDLRPPLQCLPLSTTPQGSEAPGTLRTGRGGMGSDL